MPRKSDDDRNDEILDMVEDMNRNKRQAALSRGKHDSDRFLAIKKRRSAFEDWSKLPEDDEEEGDVDGST